MTVTLTRSLVVFTLVIIPSWVTVRADSSLLDQATVASAGSTLTTNSNVSLAWRVMSDLFSVRLDTATGSGSGWGSGCSDWSPPLWLELGELPSGELVEVEPPMEVLWLVPAEEEPPSLSWVNRGSSLVKTINSAAMIKTREMTRATTWTGFTGPP